MLSGLITAFRPYLLMGFAGSEGGVFAYSGNFATVARYKRIIWQRALAAVGRVMPEVEVEPRGPVDQIYADALARVGLLVLHVAEGRKGRMHLLEQARSLAEVPHYAAVLRWIISQQAGWQDPGLMTDQEVADFLEELEARLRTDKFFRAPGEKTAREDMFDVLPDTVSATGRTAIAEAVKLSLTAGFAAAGSFAGPAGAVAGAAVGAGIVGLAKVVLKHTGEQGDYAAGIANLAGQDLDVYSPEIIGKKMAVLWAGSSL